MIKALLLFSFISTLCYAGNSCKYGEENQCESGFICTRMDRLISECEKINSELPYVAYPFPAARGILCDQGAISPFETDHHENSHTFFNTLYALDLKTPLSSDPDGIMSGIDGWLYVYNECKEYNTDCGNGWGNHIRILGKEGTVVQYAHLEKVWVKTGDYIKAGTYMGLEGTTGATGKDNRHLHISVHEKSNSENFYAGHLPKSIPFKMNICQDQFGTCNGEPIDIRKLQCKRVTGKIEYVRTF